MTKTVRSRWGSFLCRLFGSHQGNLQWGEYAPEDTEHRKIIHKCSCCWKLSKEELKELKKHKREMMK
jgi:hypothetical protein